MLRKRIISVLLMMVMVSAVIPTNVFALDITQTLSKDTNYLFINTASSDTVINFMGSKTANRRVDYLVIDSEGKTIRTMCGDYICFLNDTSFTLKAGETLWPDGR